MEIQEKEQLSLDNIPIEVFLHITTFLPASQLINTLSLVSKYFHLILSNEQTWKIRQAKLFKQIYPPVQFEAPVKFYAKSTLKREEEIAFWSKNVPNIVELRDHIACIDAVHLFKCGTRLLSGSRDRSIALYDVASQPHLIKHVQGAHKGWIWGLQTTDSHMISAGWDTFVKIWDIQSFQLSSQFKARSAVLAISTLENVTSAATFNKEIYFFDQRCPTGTHFIAHKKCVLGLGMDETRVISCGEDGRVVLYDRKAGKIRNSVKLPNYPKCLSFGKHNSESNPIPIFYVGDIKGSLYLLTHDLKVKRCYPAIHSRAVQAVFHTLGSVLTCSADGVMTVREPSWALNVIKHVKINAELPAVHILENRVALGGGDSVVRIFSNNS